MKRSVLTKSLLALLVVITCAPTFADQPNVEFVQGDHRIDVVIEGTIIHIMSASSSLPTE